MTFFIDIIDLRFSPKDRRVMQETTASAALFTCKRSHTLYRRGVSVRHPRESEDGGTARVCTVTAGTYENMKKVFARTADRPRAHVASRKWQAGGGDGGEGLADMCRKRVRGGDRYRLWGCVGVGWGERFPRLRCLHRRRAWNPRGLSPRSAFQCRRSVRANEIEA